MEGEAVDTRTGARRAFADLFYLVDGFRSGHHHPEGALWIRTGRGRVHAETVSILDIAPTVLAMFGIAPPPSMRGKRPAGGRAGAYGARAAASVASRKRSVASCAIAAPSPSTSSNAWFAHGSSSATTGTSSARSRAANAR